MKLIKILLGKKWHQRRKILTPTFHFHILEEFLEIFKQLSKKFIYLIEKEQIGSPVGVDVIPICDQIMLDAICGNILK